MSNQVLVTGGAGYVGANLIPKLLRDGYRVTVIDWMIYGEDVIDSTVLKDPHFELVRADIRDQRVLRKKMVGVDSVIHLACISNDPSFDLAPELGRSINLDAFRPLVEISKEAGVKKFIYASSSSVYGVKNEPQVIEEMPLEPLTDYSRYKARCEEILKEYFDDTWACVTIRPATVCGYSRRQRLDVIVNILTTHAFYDREIKVFGGNQRRPNIHIEDMTDLYLLLLRLPREQINRRIYNAGHENHTVDQLALMVQQIIGPDVRIVKSSSNDNRSYQICSDKIEREIGFKPTHSIQQAVVDLRKAFEVGLLKNALTDNKYINIKQMLSIGLEKLNFQTQ